jgi:hypothetical protein
MGSRTHPVTLTSQWLSERLTAQHCLSRRLPYEGAASPKIGESTHSSPSRVPKTHQRGAASVGVLN